MRQSQDRGAENLEQRQRQPYLCRIPIYVFELKARGTGNEKPKCPITTIILPAEAHEAWRGREEGMGSVTMGRGEANSKTSPSTWTTSLPHTNQHLLSKSSFNVGFDLSLLV
jgi:hypothetical protein